MADINTTVNDALQANGLNQYASYADPVKQALIQREQDNTAAILDAARQQGIEEADVRALFEGLGMHLPDEPDTRDAVDASMTDDDRRHEDRINALEAFARQHGFNG